MLLIRSELAYQLSILYADLIRDIKDPEHPHTLEELNVVNEQSISIEYRAESVVPSTEQGKYLLSSNMINESFAKVVMSLYI